MADERWLVIVHPDGRSYEVADVDYERFGSDNWPGFKVTGYKDGGSYTKKAAEAAAEEAVANESDPGPTVVIEPAKPEHKAAPARHTAKAK